MKQTIYYLNPNANKAFEQELWSNAKEHKAGDRISVSLYYAEEGSNKKLLSMAQLRSALADLYREEIYLIPMSPLNSGSPSKVIFQVSDKDAFETMYTVKNYLERETKTKKEEKEEAGLIELIEGLLEKDLKEANRGATEGQRLDLLLGGLRDLLD